MSNLLRWERSACGLLCSLVMFTTSAAYAIKLIRDYRRACRKKTLSYDIKNLFTVHVIGEILQPCVHILCGAVPAAGLTCSEAEAQHLRLPCVVVGLARSGQRSTPAVGG